LGEAGARRVASFSRGYGPARSSWPAEAIIAASRIASLEALHLNLEAAFSQDAPGSALEPASHGVLRNIALIRCPAPGGRIDRFTLSEEAISRDAKAPLDG